MPVIAECTEDSPTVCNVAVQANRCHVNVVG